MPSVDNAIGLKYNQPASAEDMFMKRLEGTYSLLSSDSIEAQLPCSHTEADVMKWLLLD